MFPSVELSYFLEVANSLNLSRASERLGISQPSLSIAVKRLEKNVGTPLFIRQKKGVMLTQAGKQLLSHTKKLLQSWDDIKSQTLASHQLVQGSFTIGCHTSVGLHYLSKFIPKLMINHPKLEIKMAHDISRKINEGVINLSIDIGIVVNPIKHPDLIIQKLLIDEVSFWHAPKYDSKATNLSSKEAVIICDPELTQTQWLLKALAKEDIQYSRILSSSNLEIIANLTANGAGVGVLPSSVALSAYQKQLALIPNSAAYQDQICLVYRHENREIKAIQEIVKEIKKNIT